MPGATWPVRRRPRKATASRADERAVDGPARSDRRRRPDPSPSVAGSFYPAEAHHLGAVVEGLLDRADRLAPDAGRSTGPLLGLLVPHAGLAYSGLVAAAGWRLLRTTAQAPASTIVLLGTNHVAGGLDGVAAWEAGAWRTPLGDMTVDAELALAILALGPPFAVDHAAHLGEHSIEVQLPLLQVADPTAWIVPLSVSAGTGRAAIAAGRRLGALLAGLRVDGHRRPILAISTDMAHYPPGDACARITAGLLDPILRLDPARLVLAEAAVVDDRTPGLVCGMCGIQPAVLGLAALKAMGASHAVCLATATSADAGGPHSSMVGYLAASFEG